MFNTTECGWEGGDCLPCDPGYFGINCDLYYPNCSVPVPELIGDGGVMACLTTRPSADGMAVIASSKGVCGCILEN